MEIKIETKQTNPFFKRAEIKGTLGFEQQTPSRKEVGMKVATELKTKPELVIIKKIGGVFGDRKGDFTAFVYESKEALDKTESEVYKKRNAMKEEKEEKQSAPAETKEEVKQEEKKEVKEEAKKEEAQAEDKKEVKEEKKE